MRRNIKLTGRKDIPFNAFKMIPTEDKDIIDFDISKNSIFETFDPSASIVLRMTENKFTEHLQFGTIGTPVTAATPSHSAFRAPSCQLRVVSTNADSLGLVLGSTSDWTLKVHGTSDDETSGRGILLFQPKDIAPRTWKLEIRDDEHPILYVDETIPEPTDWARRDPVFRASVMPAVVERVMHHLLAHHESIDYEWAQEWLTWADGFVPETKRPINGEESERERWVDILVDEFCRQYKFHDRLLVELIQEK